MLTLFHWQITFKYMNLQFLMQPLESTARWNINHYHCTFAQTFSAILDVLVPEELLVFLA